MRESERERGKRRTTTVAKLTCAVKVSKPRQIPLCNSFPDFPLCLCHQNQPRCAGFEVFFLSVNIKSDSVIHANPEFVHGPCHVSVLSCPVLSSSQRLFQMDRGDMWRTTIKSRERNVHELSGQLRLCPSGSDFLHPDRLSSARSCTC